MNEIDLRQPRALDLTSKEKWTGVSPAGDVLSSNAEYLTRNGKPWIMVAGEMHPTRYPREQWEEAVLKMKAGGLNTVASYFFWSQHEEEEGIFTFSGQRDLRHFVGLCAKHGLYVFIRIGPFCNGEVHHGGLPPFLKEKGVRFRTNDPVYFDYVRTWYRQVGIQMQGLMFRDGGPIVGVQLENEFEHAPFSWGFAGQGGEEHMLILKRLAIEAGLVVPYYSCTAWGSPVPSDEMLPVQGGYAWISPGGPTAYYLFNDMHSVQRGEDIVQGHNLGTQYDPARYPVANMETGPGFFCSGQWRPNIPPESAEAIAMMMTARGGNVLGYYMYQGGSQFIGKHGSTGWPASYDWQGPLREFGQANAIYDVLKLVNFFLGDFPELLAPMVVALPPKPVADRHNVTELRFGARVRGQSGFLFLNNYQDRVQMPERKGQHVELVFHGKTLRVPAEGGFDLPANRCAILPFHLEWEGARLEYALAQLLTRTTTDDGRPVYVFFVPEGMEGHYVFTSAALAGIKATSATVSAQGARTKVTVQPGTDCLIEVRAASGHTFAILTLTRAQALRLSRFEIFGRHRLVLSESDVLAADGKLRVSKIGGTTLDFAVFPAPKAKLVAETGALLPAEGRADGVFRRYELRLAEAKPDISFQGIGSREVQIRGAPSVMEGIHDLFLRIVYLGDSCRLFQDGTMLCENLSNRTPWEIGLRRFRDKLSGNPLVLQVEPPAPVVEIVDNLQVNTGRIQLEVPKSSMLVGHYGVAAPVSSSPEKGYVSSVAVLPEYAVWVRAEGDASAVS